MSFDVLYSPLVLFGISTLLWWLLLSPIAIYYLLYYYRHRNNVSIKHRHWQIVLLTGMFCIFFWSIERPLELVWKIQGLNLNKNTLTILRHTHYILFPITVHGFIWCIVWRYYMIYYNIKFYEENINMKWKIIINYNMSIKNKQNKDANWFLVYKNKYGSLKWLTSRICIIFTLLMILLIFTQFYNQLIASILDGIISFLSLPILFILWYKTPIIDNGINIGMEYIYIIILCVIEWCFYFGGSFLNMVIHSDSVMAIDNMTFLFIQSWSGIIFAFCIVIICTKWTLYKCNICNVNSNTSTSTTPTASAAIRSLRSLSAVGSNSAIIHNKNNHRKLSTISPRGRQLKLYECLQCNQGFNCFMNHLMSEFSHECLLSIIEFIQFKKCLSYSYTDVLGANQLCLPSSFRRSISPHSSSCSNIEDSPSNSSLSPTPPILTTSGSGSGSMTDYSMQNIQNVHSRHEILTCQFPACVPKSFIVFKTVTHSNKPVTKQDVLTEYKIKACQLFAKYIYNKNDYCPYEININYNQRKKLMNLMVNKEKWIENVNNALEISGFEQLYSLFDHCILEMYDLMSHSFQRFKKTPQFAKLDKKIFCKSSFPDTFLN